MTSTTLPRSKLTPNIAGYQQPDKQAAGMVLIHGVGMNADYWSNITPALQTHFSLTVIDMPGHGSSPALTESHPTLQRYTDVIAEALAVAMTDPAIVVGHSMGALIALDLADRYPQITSGIGVFNGIYRRDAQAAIAIQKRVAELQHHQRTDPTATLERWFGSAPQGDLAKVSEQCRQWLNAMNPSAYAAAYAAFAAADAPSDDTLQTIQCPALFMTGELEPNSTPAMSQAMSRLIPGAHCKIVPQAKHMMSLTHPTPVIDALTHYFG